MCAGSACMGISAGAIWPRKTQGNVIVGPFIPQVKFEKLPSCKHIIYISYFAVWRNAENYD